MTGHTPPLPPHLRAYLASPELAAVWSAARARLERNGLRITGSLPVDLDDAAADRLSGLLGRPLQPGVGRPVKLADLDEALRRSAAQLGLVSALQVIHGRPLTDRGAARRQRQTQWTEVWQRLDTALAGAGLADAAWVPGWIAGLQRTGVLTRAGIDAAGRALEHAVTALAVLLPPEDGPPVELAALASRVTGDAHGLDDTTLASLVVLRAAAQAHDRPVPETAAQRRDLWQMLGVATDAISGTVLTWRLQPPGPDRWSSMMRDRAHLGLITHLTLHELDHAGAVPFARPGQAVFACENPQVLQAAARADVDTPMVCLSGNPAAAGTRLLQALIAAGNPVRYHGDFDWPGVAIAGRIVSLGASPWRMSAADYRAAVSALDADHAIALTGKPVGTAWDQALGVTMQARGLAVHEEAVLPELLTDLIGDRATRDGL
ncbi:TIGR02679 family protein [Dactylosporangium sp. CA-139066]|uniref:TIGR02679 family protein n=1 Tax=Dactylosporangium sp. CA-139066 TaxID=3239930 RepID=UPI003D928A99